MLDKNKARSLCMFAHTRLANSLNKDIIKVIKKSNSVNTIIININTIVNSLAQDELTIEYLNNMKDGPLSGMLTYYYEVALEEIKKYIKADKQIIEIIIGLSILEYLENVKKLIKIEDSIYTETKVINNIEISLSIINKTLEMLEEIYLSSNFKYYIEMQILVNKIIEVVDKANYKKHIIKGQRNIRRSMRKK